jgi:recombination DNA repair RAD52 pathway protein
MLCVSSFACFIVCLVRFTLLHHIRTNLDGDNALQKYDAEEREYRDKVAALERSRDDEQELVRKQSGRVQNKRMADRVSKFENQVSSAFAYLC